MIIEFLKNIRNERLKTANLDPRRLLSIARSASRTGFGKESGGLPICLFNVVELSTETFQEHRLVITDYEKGSLTEPLMAPTVLNEEEWFAETVKEHVAADVMPEILSQLESVAVDASTAEQYWSELKKAAQSIVAGGLYPILLVDNRTRPRWISDWGFPPMEDHYKRPDDLRIQKRETEKCRYYIAHFNEIAVYTAPIPPGASLVMPKELFKRIVFTKFENGLPIEVFCEPTGRDEVINLVLKWAHKIESETYAITRLEYHGNEPGDADEK